MGKFLDLEGQRFMAERGIKTARELAQAHNVNRDVVYDVIRRRTRANI
jgi:hypothetical protein